MGDGGEKENRRWRYLPDEPSPPLKTATNTDEYPGDGFRAGTMEAPPPGRHIRLRLRTKYVIYMRPLPPAFAGDDNSVSA